MSPVRLAAIRAAAQKHNSSISELITLAVDALENGDRGLEVIATIAKELDLPDTASPSDVLKKLQELVDSIGPGPTGDALQADPEPPPATLSAEARKAGMSVARFSAELTQRGMTLAQFSAAKAALFNRTPAKQNSK